MAEMFYSIINCHIPTLDFEVLLQETLLIDFVCVCVCGFDLISVVVH